MRYAAIAVAATLASCTPTSSDRRTLLVIEGVPPGQGGHGVAVEQSGPTELPANKDCGRPIAEAMEAFAEHHEMAILRKELQPDRALIHLEDPSNGGRYFELLYRHDHHNRSARVSFDLLTPAGNVLAPSSVLPSADLERLRRSLETAMACH